MYIMSDQLTAAPGLADLFGPNHDEAMRLLREDIQRELASQRAAGHTTYYCGTTGDEAGKLFMHTPDDRRFEYCVREDGTREIVRELPR